MYMYHNNEILLQKYKLSFQYFLFSFKNQQKQEI